MAQLWTGLEQIGEVIADVGSRAGEVTSGEDEFNDGWASPAECVAYLREWQAVIGRTVEVVTRQPLFDPCWRTGTTIGLATAISTDRAFDRLPILADALEEAGCDHPDILAHCRGPGPHARGCWVVDLILGKS